MPDGADNGGMMATIMETHKQFIKRVREENIRNGTYSFICSYLVPVDEELVRVPCNTSEMLGLKKQPITEE